MAKVREYTRLIGFVCAAALVACLALTGCGGSASGNAGSNASSASATASGAYKDGTYTGQSSVMEDNVEGDGYGVVSVTIKDGKITDATFQAFLPDGTPKDESYGKDGSHYAVAQKIVKTGDDYVEALVEAGSIDGVDAVSGATYLYDQFVEATKAALAEASK